MGGVIYTFKISWNAQQALHDFFFSPLLRIQKQEVETDFKTEIDKTKEAKAFASKQPDLQHQMEEFLQVSLYSGHFL